MALPDPDVCFRAVSSRDARFDGWFYVGVTSTGIYCRPSCPATTPRRDNVRFYATSAAAQDSGFRACKRCRPDRAPGSPEWNVRGDLAARALRLIADGVVDRAGVTGLASQLGYSSRQLNRTLLAEVGAGPLALARAQRAHTARTLLESTQLAVTDVAFAAGFTSVRQFNDTIRTVYDATPSAVRAAAMTGTGRATAWRAAAGMPITLRLPYREPMDLAHTLGFLADRAVEGMEAADDLGYHRVMRLAHGPALVSIPWTTQAGSVLCRLHLSDQRDLTSAVGRVRRLLDLDADPVAVAQTLGGWAALADSVRHRPGLRSPGAVDGFEMAVRAIAGQLVSVASARRSVHRVVAAHGEQVELGGRTWTMFPTPAVLADADPAALVMRQGQAGAIVGLATAVATGTIDLSAGADREQTQRTLRCIKGIGPWTARYVRMRALADPDVLLTGDIVVDRALAAGAHRGDGADWAPWRSYATHHLWAAAATSRPATSRPATSPPVPTTERALA